MKKLLSKENRHIFKELSKFNLSVMNAGMVLFGAVLNTPLLSINSGCLFMGNLGMAMSSQIKG